MKPEPAHDPEPGVICDVSLTTGRVVRIPGQCWPPTEETETMIPAPCRTVLMLGSRALPDEPAPAIITRTFSARSTTDGPVAVNVTALPDMAPPESHGSVLLYHDEEQARAARFGTNLRTVAWWPARA